MTSEIEWWFVVDPEDKEERARSRVLAEGGEPSAAFQTHKPYRIEICSAAAKKNEELRKINTEALKDPEFYGARLYSGPMYQKYNAVLRGSSVEALDRFHEEFKSLCSGNPTQRRCTRSTPPSSSCASSPMRARSIAAFIVGCCQRSFGRKMTLACGVASNLASFTLDRNVAIDYAALAASTSCSRCRWA